ncbi:serine hydrolase domain-containing protein [Rhodovarius crocodyli]|nr:serine hydrolase domain-containing protein [Rhodovarius crocodyli]
MSMILWRDGLTVAGADDGARRPWWSLTKTAIAAGVLALARDGLVALDEPLPVPGATPRALLLHRAGLPDYGWLAGYHAAVAEGGPAWSAGEMLARAAFLAPPAAGFSYSNIGYMHLRQLVEARMGMPFSAAIRSLVLGPLGLTATALADAPGVPGHPDYDPGWVYHGLLMGPVEEMALFLHRLFTGPLLPRELLAMMRAAEPVGGALPGRPWLTPGYGLGLMAGEIAPGIRMEGHTGGGPGSAIVAYRRPDTVSVVAGFAEGPAGDALESEAARLLLA